MPDTTTTFEWQRLIRRARLHPSTKLVAFALATYANADGTRAYPGVDRLAATTRLSTKTVRAGLASLREAGLVKRVNENDANRRRGFADVYNLRFPDGLDRRIHMLDVAESPESEECDEGCEHPPSAVASSSDRAELRRARRVDQGNSVPRSGEVSSQSGEVSSTFTGNGFPPPKHYHPLYLSNDLTSDQVRDATTERVDGEPHINVIPFDRRAQ